jgi:excinuclease ABC subunit C
LLEENKALPHLIVVDGGKGQLSSALNSLRKLNMEDKVEIISIAKRLEELFKPNDSLPLYLDKRSETLKLIQRIRNEAHRFAITFHRQKKQTLSLTSQLDEIEGIGVKTKELLLINFKSLDVVALQSLVDLESLLGKKKASIIWKHFHGNSLFDN